MTKSKKMQTKIPEVDKDIIQNTKIFLNVVEQKFNVHNHRFFKAMDKSDYQYLMSCCKHLKNIGNSQKIPKDFNYFNHCNYVFHVADILEISSNTGLVFDNFKRLAKEFEYDAFGEKKNILI